MSTLSNALKAEISRVTRKTLRDELLALKKAAQAHRAEIAALKRELKHVRAQLDKAPPGRRVVRAAEAPDAAEAGAEASPGRRRAFSPERFAALRAKLGLSQVEMAQLLGCSPLSVARWESGKVKPRAAQLQSIESIRGLGKREAARRLAELG
jgi:DNA-binding transcriptional regulator YiaG